MRNKLTLTGLVIGLFFISFGIAIAKDTALSASKIKPDVILTGTITARNGNQVTLKSDDGKLYTVNAEKAAVFLDKLPGNVMSLRVGDKTRIYGETTAPSQITASRIHIFLADTEAAATTAKPTGYTIPSGSGSMDDGVEIPGPGDSLGNWRSRALVLSVDYNNRTVSVATSKGSFDLDVSAATVVQSNRSVSLANISQGDAVRIWGEIVGLNKIRVDRIEVIRSKGRQEAAVPLKITSFKGEITSIDYPSFTFKVMTESGEVRVLADENSYIHFQSDRKAFQNLTIGQLVKVDGIGSLSTGYAAKDILIIGGPVD